MPTPSHPLSLIVVPDDAPPFLLGTYLEPRVRAMAKEVRWFTDSRPTNDQELLERIVDAEAVINISVSVRFTRWVLERCPHLRLLTIWAVGTDNVDLEAAEELGITVCNTPGYATEGVAEHTLALALAVARKIAYNDRRIRRGGWAEGLVGQLYGKALGVVGAGPIAKRVVKLGKALGMQVVAWTLHPSKARARRLGAEFVELDELLSRSDVVSVNIALSDETKRLIGRRELALLKPTAIIVNTARGAIIDEEALLECLESKRIAGAGLDAFSQEPLPEGHPFTRLDNVVLSPHSAALSLETSLAGLEIAVANIEHFLEGRLTNVVAKGRR